MTNKENWSLQYRGYWKFKDDYVSLQELEKLAKEWAQDERYVSLHIRKTSSDQHGIGFTYSPEENTQETHNQFIEEMSDSLRRQFGNGLAGWDISSGYLQVK